MSAMDTASNLLFPYDSVRMEQSDLLQQINECLSQRKHLVAHAPTGLGKTAAVLAPCLRHAIDNKLTVFFLTSRHTQHLIAIQTLKEIKEKYGMPIEAISLAGKKNMCLQPGVEQWKAREFYDYCKSLREDNKCEYYANIKSGNNVTVEAKKALADLKAISPCHTDTVLGVSREAKVCPYELGALFSASSSVIIGDYNYIFSPSIRESFFSRTQNDLGRSIIIIDEAHNLPSRVRDTLTSTLSSTMIQFAIKDAKEFGYEDIIPMLAGLQEILVSYGEGMRNGSEKLIQKKDFEARVNAINLAKTSKAVIEELSFIGEAIRQAKNRSSLPTIAEFLEAWNSSDDGFARIFSVRDRGEKTVLSLSYRCLDPAVACRDVIQQSYCTIAMSGTLLPTEMYRDMLGFPSDAVLQQYESPFSDENKLSLIVPETTTKYERRSEEMFQRIAEICAGITNAVPGNCAIFFPSYAIRDTVYKYFYERGEKTAFREEQAMTKQDKVDLLQKFKEYQKAGAVLLGAIAGSFAEGIDLPGDLLKCVIVVGLPLTKPDLETQELIKYYDKKFGRGRDYGYILPAFTKTLQGAGRCIRTENDRGVIVFLDERYAWPMYARCFPRDSPIRVTTQYKEYIEAFFEQ